MSSGLANGPEVVELAGAIMSAFDDPFALGLEELTATVSVGVVVADDPSVRAESLVTDAESALERDRSGVRRFEVFDAELRERIRYRAEIGRELAAALDADDIAFHYQPIVDIASGRIASVEALARWHHPERGAISPELFVPIAEETGSGADLLVRLLSHAAADFPTIAAADASGQLSLAINVSSSQLTSDPLIASVGELVETLDIDPSRVIVEISESALSGAAEAYLQRVTELRALRREDLPRRLRHRLDLDRPAALAARSTRSSSTAPSSSASVRRQPTPPSPPASCRSPVHWGSRSWPRASRPRASSPTSSRSATARARATCSRGPVPAEDAARLIALGPARIDPDARRPRR